MENETKINCPEHLNGEHKATLYTYPHRWAGIWECPLTGTSDTCQHEERRVETTSHTYPDNDGEPIEVEGKIYVCDTCGVALDGDPEQDEAEYKEMED